MQAMMMEAKKKALRELIKKMRTLEATEGLEESAADEALGEEDVDDLDDELAMEEAAEKPGEMVEKDPIDDEMAERQDFMRNGYKKPLKGSGKTKALIMSVSLKGKGKKY